MGALCIDFAAVLIANQMHSVYQDHLAEIINNNAPFKTLSVKGKKRRLRKTLSNEILRTLTCLF